MLDHSAARSDWVRTLGDAKPGKAVLGDGHGIAMVAEVLHEQFADVAVRRDLHAIFRQRVRLRLEHPAIDVALLKVEADGSPRRIDKA